MDLNVAETWTSNFIKYTARHSFYFWREIAYLGLKDHERCIQFFDKHIQEETHDVVEDWVEINAFYLVELQKESDDLGGAMTD